MADAEGKAGDNPEENLGSGARNLIRFKPIIMKSRKTSIGQSSNNRIRLMMNKGAGKLGQTKFDSGGDKDTSPMGSGLDKAIRARFRKRPNTLRDPRKMSGLDTSATEQKGLKTKSKKNFKDKKRQDKRRKLDVSF